MVVLVFGRWPVPTALGYALATMGRTLYRCDLDDRPHEPKPTCVDPEVSGYVQDATIPVTHELVAEWLEPERAHVIGATFETCPVCVADRRPSHP